MSRKSLAERRTEKLAQMETLKKELAKLETKAGERVGKLAVRAGLADLDIDDDVLLREFQSLAARFRERGTEPAESAPPSADST